MGSSGSGRISDYPGTSGSGGGSSQGRGGGGGGGGQPPEDRCGRAFSASLEDIEHSDYFRANGQPPPDGTPLEVRLGKRLIGVTSDGQSVGNLPTALNYLAACIRDGWQYTGMVTDSGTSPPTATVMADFAAIAP